MEKVLLEICLLFVFHFIFDFVCQTRHQTDNKSRKLGVLLSHTGMYSLLWLVFLLPFNLPFIDILYFVLITFLTHTGVDFITSKFTSHFYKTKRTHLFFITVGFDQLLHQIQLILTYWFILK